MVAMKKKILICIICFAFMLCSCGKETAPAPSTQSEPSDSAPVESRTLTEAAKERSAAEILDILLEAASPKEAMTTLLPGDEDYEDSFDFLFDTDISVTSDSAVCYCTSGRLADEIDVFILRDAGYASKLTNALKKRASSRASAYKGYYDTESEKAKNALILSSGNCVVFAVSDNNSDVRNAFGKLF